MKRKVELLAAAVCTAVMLTSCGSSGSAPAETTAAPAAEQTTASTVKVAYTCDDAAVKMMAEIEFPSMVRVERGDLPTYLSADIPETTDFAMYLCGSGGFADEVFITSTEGVDTEALSKAVEERIGQRYSDFEDYVPEEAEKIDNSVVAEIPGYYMYFVTADNSKCVSIAESMLGS